MLLAFSPSICSRVYGGAFQRLYDVLNGSRCLLFIKPEQQSVKMENDAIFRTKILEKFPPIYI